MRRLLPVSLAALIALSACDTTSTDSGSSFSFGGNIDVPARVLAGTPFQVGVTATQNTPIANAGLLVYRGELRQDPASGAFSADTLFATPVDVEPGVRTFSTTVSAKIPAASVTVPFEEVGIALVVMEFPCSGLGPACSGPGAVSRRIVVLPRSAG